MIILPASIFLFMASGKAERYVSLLHQNRQCGKFAFCISFSPFSNTAESSCGPLALAGQQTFLFHFWGLLCPCLSALVHTGYPGLANHGLHPATVSRPSM